MDIKREFLINQLREAEIEERIYRCAFESLCAKGEIGGELMREVVKRLNVVKDSTKWLRDKLCELNGEVWFNGRR
jgi:hypothetical protein